MRRIVVVGNSGSGKTTLAGQLGSVLGVPHIELDSLFHQAGWVPAPPMQFAAAVREALDRADASANGWVVCGNYSGVRGLVWSRADTIIWLDFSRRVVMTRVIRRSAVRAARGSELWNGNRESWGKLLALHDPERSIIRWTWDGVANYRTKYLAAMSCPTWCDLRWYHLSGPEETARLLSVVRAQEGQGVPGGPDEL